MENALGALWNALEPYERQASIMRPGVMEQLHSSVKWRCPIRGQKSPTWSNCGQGRSKGLGLRMQLQGCRLGSEARMPSHRAEVGCGWRSDCLVPLVWSLVHCSRWLRLEEAGAIGEDSMPWQHCHMSLPWPAIFHVFLSEFNLRSNHNPHFPEVPGSLAKCLPPTCSHHLPGCMKAHNGYMGQGPDAGKVLEVHQEVAKRFYISLCIPLRASVLGCPNSSPLGTMNVPLPANWVLNQVKMMSAE